MPGCITVSQYVLYSRFAVIFVICCMPGCITVSQYVWYSRFAVILVSFMTVKPMFTAAYRQ